MHNPKPVHEHKGHYGKPKHAKGHYGHAKPVKHEHKGHYGAFHPGYNVASCITATKPNLMAGVSATRSASACATCHGVILLVVSHYQQEKII